MTALTCFKAYDSRGRLGVGLEEGIARRIGRGFGRALGTRRVVVGRDIRASSVALTEAVISSTEPVVRLNVESRGDAGLVADRVAEIAALLTPCGATQYSERSRERRDQLLSI